MAGPTPNSPLARIAFAVYVLLTAYATLYPLEGWHNHGLSPFAYLAAGWPRYAGVYDMVLNVLGYVPIGLFAVAAMHPRVRGAGAFLVATALGVLLSVALEAGQTFIATRFASNLDVLCNGAGTAIGAAIALRLAPWTLEHGPLRGLRQEAFLPGTAIDVGLVLIGLWLFMQLNPATLLFGAGNLRDLLLPPEGRARTPEFFVLVEALVSGANLVAVGLLFSTLLAPGQPMRRLAVGLVVLALVVRATAMAVLIRADSMLAWLTPGAQLGLACGLLLMLAAVALPRTARLACAAVLLMAATVLVNLAPANPYFAATLKVWQQGHFLNFNGLTRLVSSAWPFVALAYVIILAARREREAVG